VGQSFGGGTAILFALQHRERVERLILAATGGLPNPPPLTAKLFCLPGVGEFLLGLNTNGVRQCILTRFYFHKKAQVTDRLFEDVTRFHKIQGTTAAGLDVLRRRFFDTLEEEIQELAQLCVPTLIIWGREDRSIPVDRAVDMHRFFRHARLELIGDAGHVVNAESPEIFNRLTLDFLRTDRVVPDTGGTVSEMPIR